MKILCLTLLLAFSGQAAAQHFGHDMRSYYDYGEQCYTGAEQSADASHLTVRINTANTLFAFENSGVTYRSPRRAPITTCHPARKYGNNASIFSCRKIIDRSRFHIYWNERSPRL